MMIDEFYKLNAPDTQTPVNLDAFEALLQKVTLLQNVAEH